MLRNQSRPAATLMFLLLVAVPLPISVLAGGLPPSETQGELSVEELNAEYPGELGFLIEQGVAEPLSLATADLDEDGMPDLVVGYGDGDAGLIAVHRGNVEAVYPKPGQDAGEAFHPVAEVFATPQRAELIGSGDFDADGRFDIVVGTLGETTLRLLRGDGTGSFADAEFVALSGELTAMAVGEVNRRDGLADVVVGVVGAAGPQLLVFESPLGAFRGAPEAFDTPEGVTTIDLGNHDEDYLRDIVAVTGSYRFTVSGRDRRLSLGQKQRAEVEDAVAVAEPLADSAQATKSAAFPLTAHIDGEIVALVSMRLNRDAIPDTVAIIEGRSAPVVVKTTARATYTVDSTADDADFSTGDGVCDTDDSVGDGPCTLRAAIQQANASSGADAIEFDIAGTGPHIIQPDSVHPTISDSVTIDGTTEPDFVDSPVVVIDGLIAGTESDGVRLSADACTIRGVALINFDGNGIEVLSGSNIFEGNFLGLDADGSTGAGNRRSGISIWGGSNHTIGGTTTAARNVISANDTPGLSTGITVAGGSIDGTVIQGNFIGTDSTGTSSVPNNNGVQNVDATTTEIGGTTAGSGNVISGNLGIGLSVSGVDATISGNLIGTDVSGTSALGNGNWGMTIGALDALIGGTSPSHRNVIAANGIDGVSIGGPSSTGMRFEGNFIGVGLDGSTPLGNARHGLAFGNSADFNNVGGSVPGSANIIAHNGRDGVIVHTNDIYIPILGNSIHSNGEEGIDLDALGQTYGDGVTPNDPDDPDIGANNLQNYPVITGFSSGGGVIDGTLDSTPSTEFRIEFFANTACDPSGYGEGETFLGADTVTTDASGDATFSSAVVIQAPIGSHVTATATDPTDNTSEFSACLQFTAIADLWVTVDDGVTEVLPGDQVTYTIVASNAGPDGMPDATFGANLGYPVNCSTTCVAAGGATCSPGPILGDIEEHILLPVGGIATYTAVCDVNPTAIGILEVNAGIDPPDGGTDPDWNNNEDFDVDTILPVDWGDAPDPAYPTLPASDGARHQIAGGLHLGSTVDADPGGQPSPSADGDDTDGTDDEDGVTFTSIAMTGFNADLEVAASAAGLLNVWLDLDGNGSWLDAGEQIFTDEPLGPGINPLSFPVPASAVPGDSVARFRFDSGGGLAPTGYAADGEVEDELVEIRFSTLDTAETGQTTSYAAGDDGTFQMGIPWPEPRFSDNGDGTLSDELTGLMWAMDNVNPGPAACNPGVTRNWFLSLDFVDCLNSNSWLGHTDWRMPNVVELGSMIHYGLDGDHRPWWNSQGFLTTTNYRWWSSTTTPGGLGQVLSLSAYASISGYNKLAVSGTAVWPVRGGGVFDGVARLPATGQETCWNDSYAEVPCAGTGQDGDHRAGAAWPSPRFEVAGDCVTDRLTGLMWTKDANLFGLRTWHDAVEDANGLSLCGFDDWRLPSVREAQTLWNFDKRSDQVPDNLRQWWLDQGFVNTIYEVTWSGTSHATSPDLVAWNMWYTGNKDNVSNTGVWPVRGNVQFDTANLSVLASDSEDPVAPGANVDYTIDVSNLGAGTVDEVTVKNTLPDGAVFVGAAGSGWTCGEDTGIVTCTYGALSVGAAPTISIEITTPNLPGVTLTNSTLVDSRVDDPVAENNAAEESTEILGQDFGDAPDPTYPTLLASDGARHSVGGALFLGPTVDSDPDGQPTAGADGDDLDGTDDEDGVTFTTALRLGLDASVQVEASAAGLLNAWIDFNADGDWDDAGEQIFTDTALAAGINNLMVAVPIDATLGATFARFRFDSAGGLTPTGAAADGEVEDYALTIEPSAELGVNIGDSPDPVRQGRRLTYSVAVDNNGGLDATGVVLTDTLDGNVSFVSASLPACSETGGVVTCSLDTLSAGTSAMVFIEVDVDAAFAGTLTNTAVVALNEEDPVPANNTDTETTTVVAPGPHVFSDGFETGDTTRWSSTTGG